MLKNFPSDLKDEFKTQCKEEGVDMIDKIRFLVRNYVNETTELYKEKRIVDIDPFDRDQKVIYWRMSNFPCKLRAEFKSCCGARGDSAIDAIAHLINIYLNEGREDV
jgi:hypothetical protein